MNLKRKGDLAEHYAVAWLWEKGYEVFKNCGGTGKIDIVAVDVTGETVLIDVKTLNLKDSDYGKNKCSRTRAQKKLGVVLLGYNPITNDCRWILHHDKSNSPRITKRVDFEHLSPQLKLVI